MAITIGDPCSGEHAEPLLRVSYHVRVLVKRGLLKTGGTKPRRAAVEHFYRIAGKGLA